MMSIGAFWVGVPLPSSRPSEAPLTPGRYAAPQNIDARLWQDPLAAIKKPASKSGQTLETAAQSAQVKDGVVQIKLAIEAPPPPSTAGAQSVCAGTDTNESARVMAVMLDGAPYADAAETRRRTRYAVVSGLGRGGYVPEDGEHVGSFTASVETQPGATESVAIPFEWFRYDNIEKPDPSKTRVLVLWIDEGPIRNQPLAGVKHIVEQVCARARNLETVLIGPSNSGTLRAMLGEIKPYTGVGKPDDDLRTFLTSLRIYSPRATVPDAYLLHSTGLSGTDDNPAYCLDAGSGGTVAAVMNQAGLKFHRTVATDCALAKSLVKELRLRGVEANDGIALISEWDTAYGRALPKAFMEKNQATRKGALWQFSYLRGLDGKLPGDGADKKAETDKKSRDSAGADIETAFGNHQKDYLRRIAVRVAELDRRLKNGCQRAGNEEAACAKDGVKAIGILGSDVYDKLLILRALRPRFPEVIFFTTDLDAALLHAEEWTSARNLVVASGYGLRLNGWLQKEIPPFRDGYQSAYFLSVLATFQLEGQDEEAITRLAKGWSSAPRIFEVGRSQEVDLSKTDKDTKSCDLTSCNSPHPYVERPADAHWLGLAGLAVLLTLISGYVYRKRAVRCLCEAKLYIGAIRRQPCDWRDKARCLIANTWGFGLMIGAPLVGWLIYRLYRVWEDIHITGTADGGEPFSWFEGVSIWPSVLLRACTGLLALYLLWRGMSHLHTSDEDMTARFFIEEEETVPNHRHPKADECDNHAVCIWRDAVQPRPFTLLLLGRLGVGAVLLAVIAGLIILSTCELPNIPYRGVAAKAAHWHTLVFSIAGFLFLLAFVIDSTVRTRSLARRLGNRERTQWPQGTVCEWFPQATSSQPEAVSRYQDDWLDIQLLAARTTVVGGFIYYPFLILSLMILARSSFIDNWQIPLGLAGVFAVFLLAAIACALALRHAAERARRHAVEHLAQEIIKALGDPARKQEVEQMKLMKESILAEQRGAFSSFLNQPWLKALLLPLGSYSGIQLLESLSLMNL